MEWYNPKPPQAVEATPLRKESNGLKLSIGLLTVLILIVLGLSVWAIVAVSNVDPTTTAISNYTVGSGVERLVVQDLAAGTITATQTGRVQPTSSSAMNGSPDSFFNTTGNTATMSFDVRVHNLTPNSIPSTGVGVILSTHITTEQPNLFEYAIFLKENVDYQITVTVTAQSNSFLIVYRIHSKDTFNVYTSSAIGTVSDVFNVYPTLAWGGLTISGGTSNKLINLGEVFASPIPAGTVLTYKQYTQWNMDLRNTIVS